MATRPLANDVALTASICHHDELVEGKVRGAGLVYFVPKKTKFWTLKDNNVETTARMCTRCGAVTWFGDTNKLASLRSRAETEKQRSEGDLAEEVQS